MGVGGSMFVARYPRCKRFATDELAATEAEGRDRRAAGNAPGNHIRDMRLRAMQQRGDVGQRQQAEILQRRSRRLGVTGIGSHTLERHIIIRVTAWI